LNASAATASATPFTTVAHPTALRDGDAVIGALPMKQAIHVEVALKMRDSEGLDAFIANNAALQSRHVAIQPMTSEQFLAQHAPTLVQAQAVADYLRQSGFTNIVIAPNRLLVSADGTALSARTAFTTSFAQVRTRDGRIAFGNTDEVRIPAMLSDKVLAVVGLQTVHQAHTFAHSAAPSAVHTDAIQGHYPTEFPLIYGGDGSNVEVGIVTDGNLSPTLTDLDVFETSHALPVSEYAIVNTNGNSGDTTHTDEWDLDSQAIVGMAVSPTLVFYNIPSLTNANVTADFNTIVAANKVKIIEAAVGECETDAQADGSAKADDAIFKTAVAQGQTFSVPAGDTGTAECGSTSNAPTWPAASQYVVAVSGTTLSATTNEWLGETAWSASDGSPSTFEPMPSWQAAFGVPGTTRGVPDLAFDGNPNSGALIVANLTLTEMGGTSLSASLFAAAWSRVLAEWGTKSAEWGTASGFAGPVIYALPTTAFHDITVGSNRSEPAGVGYDFASGRGSMIVDTVLADLQNPVNHPPVADFTVGGGGLLGRFTDTSTDPDGNGTIVSHSWKFGDGTTSTATSPSHKYATSGIYSVSETVVDDARASSTKVETFFAGAVQVLKNPGFETGTLAPGWNGGAVIVNDPTFVYDGTYAALLDYAGANITQQIPLPAYDTGATLQFHLWIDNQGTFDPLRYSILNVVLVDDATKTEYATLATFSNLDNTSGYVTYSYDLTPDLGRPTYLKFIATRLNSEFQTYFYLDDITLIVK